MIEHAVARLLVLATTDPELVLATNLFVGGFADSTDDVIQVTVSQYDGPPSETYGNMVERPGVQVKVRGPRGGHNEAIVLAGACRDALKNVASVTVSGITISGAAVPDMTILRLRPLGNLIPLGVDDRERPEIAFNLEAFL